MLNLIYVISSFLSIHIIHVFLNYCFSSTTIKSPSHTWLALLSFLLISQPLIFILFSLNFSQFVNIFLEKKSTHSSRPCSVSDIKKYYFSLLCIKSSLQKAYVVITSNCLDQVLTSASSPTEVSHCYQHPDFSKWYGDVKQLAPCLYLSHCQTLQALPTFQSTDFTLLCF